MNLEINLENKLFRKSGIWKFCWKLSLKTQVVWEDISGKKVSNRFTYGTDLPSFGIEVNRKVQNVPENRRHRRGHQAGNGKWNISSDFKKSVPEADSRDRSLSFEVLHSINRTCSKWGWCRPKNSVSWRIHWSNG